VPCTALQLSPSIFTVAMQHVPSLYSFGRTHPVTVCQVLATSCASSWHDMQVKIYHIEHGHFQVFASVMFHSATNGHYHMHEQADECAHVNMVHYFTLSSLTL